MKVTAVASNNPKPLASYTEAFRAGDLIFAAGQLATDFKTGVPAEARTNPAFPYYGSDIKLQTHYILKSLQQTFAAAGSSLDNVFKAQVFLTDLNDFADFDEVWKTYFKTAPARTTVQTTGLLIKDTLVEIDLVGYVPRAGLDVRVVKSALPAPIAHYTEAFVVGDLVYAAGQLATDFKTGIPETARKKAAFPFYGSDIKMQTDFILKNLATTFAAAGSSLDNVVKAQVFLTDLNDFNGFDEVWQTFFKTPPARSTIGTGGLLIKDALIEVDLIGYVPSADLKVTKIKSQRPVTCKLQRRFHGRRHDFRRRSGRERFQERRGARSVEKSCLSVLWIGHQAPDRFHSREKIWRGHSRLPAARLMMSSRRRYFSPI